MTNVLSGRGPGQGCSAYMTNQIAFGRLIDISSTTTLLAIFELVPIFLCNKIACLRVKPEYGMGCVGNLLHAHFG